MTVQGINLKLSLFNDTLPWYDTKPRARKETWPGANWSTKIPHRISWNWNWASMVKGHCQLPRSSHSLSKCKSKCVSTIAHSNLTLPNLQLCVMVYKHGCPPHTNKLCTHPVLHYLHEVSKYSYYCSVNTGHQYALTSVQVTDNQEGTVTVTKPKMAEFYYK
jgi:hypothetical protein